MRAKKSLGQNFLMDETIVRRIVEALELSANDVVLEIGPGRGALTQHLVRSDATIIAIEIDRDIVPFLLEKFGSNDRFRLIQGDFLRADLADVLGDSRPEKVKIVGNLPYYISTPIIQKLINVSDRFERAVLMLQREVVRRLTAKPGDSDRGFITVLTENAFRTEKLFDVGPDAFLPVPKVWSSVMRLTPKNAEPSDLEKLTNLVSASFLQKRKTILNNLKSYTKNAEELLEFSGIASNRRAETLTLEEWKRLASNLL